MFERFDILAIPAVFVYDADGKEVKRYTWDDPSNQFTYEQVEKEVAELLGITPE
jgi:Tol biopolymer transport system component